MTNHCPHFTCIAAQIPDQEFLVLKTLFESRTPASWTKPASNAHFHAIDLLLQHQLPIEAVRLPPLEHEDRFVCVPGNAGQRLVGSAAPGLDRVSFSSFTHNPQR